MALNNIPKKNWWARKSQGVADWLNTKVFASPSKISDTTEISNETNEEKRVREAKEVILKKLEEFKRETSLGKDDDQLNDSLNTFLLYEEEKIRYEGFSDGGLGTRNMKIKDIASARASYIFDHAKTVIAGRLKGIEKEVVILKGNINDCINEYKTEKSFFDKILNAKRYSPRYFSVVLLIFYFLVWLGTMIADFPISVGIAEHFVSVDHLTAIGKFAKKIKNPEIFLFSIGITFLSVYFKIFYDEYFNRNIVKRDAEGLYWNPKTIAALIFNVCVLCSLLYTFYCLGNIRNALNPSSVHSNFVPEKEIFLYRLRSFIGTTILLPLISGICLSLWLGIWSNRSNLCNTQKKCKELDDQLEKYNTDLRSLERREALLESIHKEWFADNYVKKEGVILQLMSAYNQGYKKGHRLAYGFDVYDNANALYIEELTNN